MPHNASNPQAVTEANTNCLRDPTQLRRWLFAALVSSTVLGVATLLVETLSIGGIDAVDLAMILCFTITLPWTTLGFWNAVIGLIILRTSADPAAKVCPPLADTDDQTPILTRTALLSCIRNEDPDSVARNLDLMIDGLVGAGAGEHFEVFMLSDSDWPEVIAAEEARAAELAARWHGRMTLTYRRRTDNPGFKAGNIRDFCERWGANFDFLLVLDADSLMAPATILRMVRTLQSSPRLGILQTLMVGLPSASAFARPFQFGMRLGMKSYSIGSAWWQADAGPYWGHNALIRAAPFIANCELQPLRGDGPLGGWILSHDQVEAALMRRAGYEVRVMPVEAGSWEENPTTLPEFVRRDLRWCQGNLQYLKLLRLPNLHPVSRAQLLLAILMFASSPAWVMLMVLGALRMAMATGPVYAPLPGQVLFWSIMAMIFAPKLASIADALATSAGRQRFGGAPRLLLGSVAEGGPSRDSTDAIVALRFTVPLQQRSARGRLAAAQAEMQASLYEQQLLEDRIELEVRNILLELAFARQLQQLAEVGVTQSDIMRRSEQRRFESGASDFFLVNVREETAASARVTLLEAELETRIARTNYDAAIVDLDRLGITPISPLNNPYASEELGGSR